MDMVFLSYEAKKHIRNFMVEFKKYLEENKNNKDIKFSDCIYDECIKPKYFVREVWFTYKKLLIKIRKLQEVADFDYYNMSFVKLEKSLFGTEETILFDYTMDVPMIREVGDIAFEILQQRDQEHIRKQFNEENNRIIEFFKSLGF